MITSGVQAEEILQNQRADLIFIGREFLRDPYFPKQPLKSFVHPSKARANTIALGNIFKQKVSIFEIGIFLF